MAKLTLNAYDRKEKGTASSRRLRHGDKVPGIIYGDNKDPVQVSFEQKDLLKLFREETFFSHAVTLVKEDKTEEEAILRDLQRHPSRGYTMHIDFMRISPDRPVKVRVPLHFINADKCVGVKIGGGNISHSATEVEVSCLPADIPDFIPVDLAHVDLRESVHLSDLELPEKVSIVALQYGEAHDLPVASVQPPRGGLADELEEEAAAAEAETEDAAETAGGDGGKDKEASS